MDTTIDRPFSRNGKHQKQKVKPKRKSRKLTVHQRLALIVGGIGCFILALSLWHCTEALMQLTHSPMMLALLLAVGIDCGMVATEVAATASRKDSEAHRWATRYVWLAVGLSILLNGVAAGLHSEGAWMLAAVPCGVVVPVAILILGKVAAHLWTHD